MKPQNTKLIVFEDEHVLVADKPAGWNTHSPSPFANEGVYEWLKNGDRSRENLAIIHRLDKETSGLIVFGKSTAANRSLSSQFEGREVSKHYILLTDHAVERSAWTVKSALTRSGERYLSRPLHAGAAPAETRFRQMEGSAIARAFPGCAALAAEPVTGRTHQIRAHAAQEGVPILGDTLYDGTPAARVCLHAARLRFRHPVTQQELSFESTPDFGADARAVLRSAIIDPQLTNVYRILHGAAQGWPGLYVDRMGDFLLAQSNKPLTKGEMEFLELGRQRSGARGVYHKTLLRQPGGTNATQASPQWIMGERGENEIVVMENGARFSLRLDEGYSTGLFLDQRENRGRLLSGYVAPGFILEGNREMLNAFAYTCGFSVCGALSEARVTSLDLSKKYLDWGKRNFALNKCRAEEHDFIFGDAFEWFRRLKKQGRSFDLIVLDPPTFSRSKERGVFQSEKHYGSLVEEALPLLRAGGVLFASCNTASLTPERFLEDVRGAIDRRKRKILLEHYAPQPPDFPMTRTEPGYLKTVWLRVG